MSSVPYYDNKHTALYRGIVEDNADPEKLGRCKVRVPSIHGTLTYPVDILPWARPLALTPIKQGRGSVNIPDIGDIVWVLFEGANKQFPIYFGGTYATGEVEIDTDVVVFYIEGDDRISYNRSTRTYDMMIGDRHIIVTPNLVNIKGNVVIEGDVTITGDTEVKKNMTVLQDVEVKQDVRVTQNVEVGEDTAIKGFLKVSKDIDADQDINSLMNIRAGENVEVHKDVYVQGNLEVMGTSELNEVNSSGDIISRGINLTSHTHGGVESGGSSTSGPH